MRAVSLALILTGFTDRPTTFLDYMSQEGRFSVKLPAYNFQVVLEHTYRNTVLGPILRTDLVAHKKDAPIPVFAILHYDANERMIPVDLNSYHATVVKIVVENYQGTIQTKAPITVAGSPGLEATFQMVYRDRTTHGRVRSFLIGRRLFVLFFGGYKPEAKDLPDGLTFLNSFQSMP